MATGTVSSLEPNQYQLISTNTVTAAVSTTFSSLSGYKEYMVVWECTAATAATLFLRFNGSSTNYGGGFVGIVSVTISGIAVSQNANAAEEGYAIIKNADKAVPKIISGGGGVATVGQVVGVWNNTAAITSIVLQIASGTYTGSVSLYGIAA